MFSAFWGAKASCTYPNIRLSAFIVTASATSGGRVGRTGVSRVSATDILQKRASSRALIHYNRMYLRLMTTRPTISLMPVRFSMPPESSRSPSITCPHPLIITRPCRLVLQLSLVLRSAEATLKPTDYVSWMRLKPDCLLNHGQHEHTEL